MKFWPVMKHDSTVARKATNCATSCGLPRRPNAMPLASSGPRVLVRGLPSSVSITPGHMALTAHCALALFHSFSPLWERARGEGALGDGSPHHTLTQ